MAQFSFLMVLAPIVGEQMLDLIKGMSSPETSAPGVGFVVLLLGFIASFISGLFACKAMIAIVKKARLTWFALYCLVVSLAILILS